MKITISITKSELAEEYSKKLGIPVDNIEMYGYPTRPLS